MMSRLLVGWLIAIQLVLLAWALLPCSGQCQDSPVRKAVETDINVAWKREKITPAKPASDTEFLRRVSLDLIGVIPNYEETIAYLDSTSPDRRKN